MQEPDILNQCHDVVKKPNDTDSPALISSLSLL